MQLLDKINMNIVDSYGIIKINDNLSNESLIFDLNNMSDQLRDNELKAIIIFIAGPIQKKLDQENFVKNTEEIKQFFNLINHLSIPSIAIVSGHCSGVFFELALTCLMRFCTHDSIFYIPENTDSLFAGFSMYNRLIKSMGINFQKMSEISNNRTMDAEKSVAYGLCNKIFDANQLEDQVLKHVDKIFNKRAVYVIESIIKCFNEYKNLPLDYNKEFDLEEELTQISDLVQRDFVKNNQDNKGTVHES